jgi:Ca-activated chloride channel family protein
VKGEALRSLAEAGQGVALHASFGGTHLQTIVDEINKLEKTQFESTIAVQYDERFQIVALLALIFLVLELLMSDRKNAKHVWQGRFH